MSNFNDGCYSCSPGVELLAKVIAGKCQMHYTRAAVGCGMIPVGKKPETMTEPADYVMDAMISNVSIPVDGQCQVTVQLNSKNVETGFLATCILLYAQDPDIGEVPYTYLVLENNPEWIKSADSDMAKLAVFDLITAVGAIENVSADIAPNAVVTRSEMDDLLDRKVDKISGMGLSTNDYTTAEKNKLAGIAAGATANVGTVTGIKMNGASKGTSGVVDLGTVITAHQDISGKANVSHTHTKSNITDFPASLPASDVYAWAKASSKPSYTASEVGAAAASHTHLYAGSSSAGGVAASANKLETARNITLAGGLQGSFSFDGSTNVNLNSSLKRCHHYANNNAFPWHKFASCTTNWCEADIHITFLVQSTYASQNFFGGILTAKFRMNSNGSLSYGGLYWLIASNINPSDFVMVCIKPTNGMKLLVELWCKLTDFYDYKITVLSEGALPGFNDMWSLYSSDGNGFETYSDGFTHVTSRLSPIQNPVVSGS